jgi:hypothetical protein
MVTHEIELKNKELLDMLEELRKEFYRLEQESGISVCKVIDSKYPTNEYYCEEEYLNSINPDTHVGFPDRRFYIDFDSLASWYPDIWHDYIERINEITLLLGAHNTAIALMYPPEGFVDWHTNWNNSSYQILVTWSETGEGYFRYKDPATGEIITLHDKPGWNVRYHYFGSKKEPDHVLWHCAYTKCDRFSFAFRYKNGKLNSHKDAIIKKIFEDTIVDIRDV